MKNEELTERQKNFCLEYLKDFNGTKAAIRSGYSTKTSPEQAARLLRNVKVQDYLKLIQQSLNKQKIMDATEIQERLTLLARGETEEEVIVVEGTGLGESTAKRMKKKVSARDQVKALELLGKANSLFVEKVDADINKDSVVLLKEYIQGAKDGKFTKSQKE